MTLSNILAHLYPGIDFVDHVILSETGILIWNDPRPQPNIAELMANFDADLYVNRQQWAAQAQSRKEREARKALAMPDSDDPKILKQKLNAALALLNVR